MIGQWGLARPSSVFTSEFWLTRDVVPTVISVTDKLRNSRQPRVCLTIGSSYLAGGQWQVALFPFIVPFIEKIPLRYSIRVSFLII